MLTAIFTSDCGVSVGNLVLCDCSRIASTFFPHNLTNISVCSALGLALGLSIQDVVKSVTSPSSAGISWMFQNRTATLLSDDKSIRSALNIIVKDVVSQ